MSKFYARFNEMNYFLILLIFLDNRILTKPNKWKRFTLFSKIISTERDKAFPHIFLILMKYSLEGNGLKVDFKKKPLKKNGAGVTSQYSLLREGVHSYSHTSYSALVSGSIRAIRFCASSEETT